MVYGPRIRRLKMRKIFLTTFLFLLIISIVSSACAAEVVLKIRAVNPLKKPADTLVKEYLPKGVTPNDIINKGSFKIAYDKAKDLYYAEQKLTLKPKEVLVLQVEVKDVWVISNDKIDALRTDAKKALASRPATMKSSKTADSLFAQINKTLDKVAARQPKNTITKVGVESHMEEYWKDVDSLKQVESDIKLIKLLFEKKEPKKTDKK